MNAITDQLPGWVPDLLPVAETARWAAAVLGLLVLGAVLVHLYRRVRGPVPVQTGNGGPEGDRTEKRLIRIALVLAPIMLGVTFIGSFHAVYHLAERHGVAPAWVPPLAIDGILVLFLVADLLFAKQGNPNAFVKQTTRGFIAFTLVANGISGFPDVVAVLLHIPAPLGIVVITEVTRQALVRQAKRNAGEQEFEPIPLTRWFLAPVSTFLLWRWRVLHDIRSYSDALRTDMIRRDALAMLKDLSDSQRRQVPGYLRRRLRTGMDVIRTAGSVRSLVSTLMVGAHLPVHTRPVPARTSSTPAPRAGEGVHPESTRGSTPDVYTPPEVHPVSTPAYTPGPESRPAEVDGQVYTRVDETGPQDPETVPEESGPAPVSTPAPTTGVYTPSDGVDGPEAAHSVHVDAGWTSTPQDIRPADTADQTGTSNLVPARADVSETGADDEDDEDGPEDDGPRGGGGAPAPRTPVVAGQGHTPVDAGPDPIQYRQAFQVLGGQHWYRLPEDATKKDQLMTLLWEFSGDTRVVRDVYRSRTGEGRVPSDLSRHPGEKSRPGYAWQWHHELAEYLVKTLGHVDTVRDVLERAGVDLAYPAIASVLDEWEHVNRSEVIQFRPYTRTGV